MLRPEIMELKSSVKTLKRDAALRLSLDAEAQQSFDFLSEQLHGLRRAFSTLSDVFVEEVDSLRAEQKAQAQALLCSARAEVRRLKGNSCVRVRQLRGHATIYTLLSMLPSPVWRQHGAADTHSVLSSRRRADSCAEETISVMPRLGLNDLTSLAQPLGVRVVHQSGELRFDTIALSSTPTSPPPEPEQSPPSLPPS